MKKILLSLSALLILGLPKISAQIIPNLGFEIWTANNFSTGSAPDPNTGNGTSGWWDFNVTSSSLLGNSPLTVFEGSSNPAPENGSHYAEIVSDTMTATAYTYLTKYGFEYAKTNGLMFTGYEDVTFTAPYITFKSGIPCNNGLKSFSFYYRYVPNGADSCSCTIAMYQWNSTTKKRVLVGGGLWGSNTKQTSWTQQTVNISYTGGLPDTALIIFSACAKNASNNPKQYDTLDIDNGSIVLGLDNITAEHDNVKLYPNPANTQVNLAISGQFEATHVEVYDITGRSMGNYNMHNNFLTINTQYYSNGLYIYKLLDDGGNQLNVGKFSVVK